MTGILQSHHLFILPALAPLFYNLGIIIGIIFLSPFYRIFGPAVGVVIGSFFPLFNSASGSNKDWFQSKAVNRLRNPYVKRDAEANAGQSIYLSYRSVGKDYCRCRLQQFSGRDHNLIQFRQTTLHSSRLQSLAQLLAKLFQLWSTPDKKVGKSLEKPLLPRYCNCCFCFASSRFTFSFKNSGGQIGLRIQRISLGSHTFNRKSCGYFLLVCPSSSH